jgi:hypothetical protein
MNIALLLHHGVRDNAFSEVTRSPHIELLASTAAERDRLKVLANELAAFGSIPFHYKELEGTGSDRVGAVMRIPLHERAGDAGETGADR